MRKSKFSEHQIIATLKAVERGAPQGTSVASTRSAKRLTTTGSRSTAGWKPLLNVVLDDRKQWFGAGA